MQLFTADHLSSKFLHLKDPPNEYKCRSQLTLATTVVTSLQRPGSKWKEYHKVSIQVPQGYLQTKALLKTKFFLHQSIIKFLKSLYPRFLEMEILLLQLQFLNQRSNLWIRSCHKNIERLMLFKVDSSSTWFSQLKKPCKLRKLKEPISLEVFLWIKAELHRRSNNNLSKIKALCQATWEMSIKLTTKLHKMLKTQKTSLKAVRSQGTTLSRQVSTTSLERQLKLAST